MISLRHLVIGGLLCTSLSFQTGCAIMHELQPHRLWRLNRQPPPPSTANFSVTDTLPVEVIRVPDGAQELESGSRAVELTTHNDGWKSTN